MKNLCVLLVIGFISNHALCFRIRRQTTDEQESELDDRYSLILQQSPGQPQFPGQFPSQFPGQGQVPGQFPGFGQQQATTSTTATPPSAANEATTSSAIRACIANCPVTSEYNPVCGTDSNTYTNPGRLMCAQACGVSVTLLRTFPCPPTTAPPQ